MHTMQNCFSVLKLWLSEVQRSKVNSSEKCESCLCLPKDCCFRHSAVWVSPLQLMFLKFSHLSLSFRCNLKKKANKTKPVKKAAKTASVLESLVRTVLGCCNWRWEAQTDFTGQWTGTASQCPSSLSCSSPHCHWPGAPPMVKASWWPSAMRWRCFHSPPLFPWMGAGPCWSEDFGISERFQY